MNAPELEFSFFSNLNFHHFLNKINRLLFSMNKNLLNKEIVKIQNYSTVRKNLIYYNDDKIPISFDSDKNKTNFS
jgi:hypothetical protein